MQLILLQIVSDTLKQGASSSAVTPQDMSLIDLFVKAGWIMVPLLLLSIATIYVFIERWMAIGKAASLDENFMNIIRDNVVSGNIVAARNFARNTDNPVGRMIDKGLQRIGKPLELISSSMENVAQLELFKLEKNVNILSVVSKTAPIFGFIGTLVGLMQLFYNINATGEYELSTIAGGIYTKLISSITGLLIGMIAYLLHNILQTRVERAANGIEAAAADFMDVLQEPTRS
jgi:biopolymer transport protein ExbB